MLITVTTTSQTLQDILSASQISQIVWTREGWEFNYLIQNLGTQDIYLEFWAASTTTGWVKIAQDDTFSVSDKTLWDANLIADGANNTNIRVISN